jgi:hypothetical protein
MSEDIESYCVLLKNKKSTLNMLLNVYKQTNFPPGLNKPIIIK